MAINDLSQRISGLSQRLEKLKTKCVNNPDYAPEDLENVLDSLQASLGTDVRTTPLERDRPAQVYRPQGGSPPHNSDW